MNKNVKRKTKKIIKAIGTGVALAGIVSGAGMLAKKAMSPGYRQSGTPATVSGVPDIKSEIEKLEYQIKKEQAANLKLLEQIKQEQVANLKLLEQIKKCNNEVNRQKAVIKSRPSLLKESVMRSEINKLRKIISGK